MSVKKYFSLFILLVFVSTAATAQYDPWWKWARADAGYATQISNGGSVLAVKNGKAFWGRMSAIKYTNSNGAAMGNWFLAEYDSTGKQLGATVIAGKVQLIDVQADAQGNWYVIGRYYDSAVFQSATYLRNNPASNTDPDYFMCRFSSSFIVMDWYKPIGYTNSVSVHAFTIDNTKLYFAADSTDATYVRSVALATGVPTPMFKQTGKSLTTSMQVDASGNLYMAGGCADKGGINFNGTNQPANPGTTYGYVAKYNASGAHVWHLWMRDTYCDQRKLTLFKNSFLYYTGSLHDSLMLGIFPFHQPYTAQDYLAARLDPSNGGVIWARQLDTTGGAVANLSDMPHHATVTPDTALVIFAQGHEYIDWRDGVITNLQNTYAALPVAIGPGGDTRWARPILAQNTTNANIVDEGDDVWVSGNANSNTGFVMMDTLKLSVPTMTWVPYLAMLRLTRPPYVAPPNGVSGLSGNGLEIYPNPARTALRVTGLQGHSQLILSDLSSRVVLEQFTDKTEELLNVGSLPRGAYFLRMSNGEGAPVVRKIVLQ